MRSSSMRTWLAATMLAALGAACGGSPEVPDPVDDGLAWHLPKHAPARRRGLSMKEYVQLILPEARHAGVDNESDFRAVPRMVVNLLRDGNVMFKGCTYPLATGNAEEVEASLLALRDELQTLTANPEWRDTEGTSLCTVLLHADRVAPWEQVTTLIRVAREPSIRMDRIQWAVGHWANNVGMRQRVDWRVGSTLTAINGIESAEPALAVRLEGRETAGTTEVTLRIGTRAWSFGTGKTDFLDDEFVTLANGIWAEAEQALEGSLAGHDRAELTLPEQAPGVTWGHVVTAFDLLVGAGFRIVDLPVQGWRLVLEEPDEPPLALRDDPVLTPWAVAAVVLGLLLGVFVTLWPLRSRARRRAVPSRS